MTTKDPHGSTRSMPVNVRVRHEDGTFTACEFVYEGEDGKGGYTWRNVRSIALKVTDTITQDRLPEGTVLVIA